MNEQHKQLIRRLINEESTRAIVFAYEKMIADGYELRETDEKNLAEHKLRLEVLEAIDAPQPSVQGLDMPDSPGWWIFEGSEWGSEPIWPDDYDPDDEDSDRDEWISPIGYHRIKGEPFCMPLLVRYSTHGETVSFSTSHGRYNGEPILGYLNTHHSWDHCLHSLDHLVGKWYKLNMPCGKSKESSKQFAVDENTKLVSPHDEDYWGDYGG